MDADLQRRVDDLFDRALDQPAASRRAFVEHEAGDDLELRAAVDELLDLTDDADDPNDGPLLESDSLSDILDGGALRGPLFDGFAEQLDRAPTADLAPGARVGSFEIVREIGRGGMAVVYLAERVAGGFEQQAAIKIIQAGIATDDVLSRFAQERQILATLDHPSIAKVYEGGATADGRPYLAMELVRGRPIDRFCAEEALDLRARLRLFVAVARVVGHAHRRLVVHRDLKPANILVTDRDPEEPGDGAVKLLDFGIAKLLDPDLSASPSGAPLTRTAVRPMTPEYASPEQVLGRPVSTASDVYQLGMLLYELLTGLTPWRASTPADARPTRAELERAIVEEPPSRPSTVVTRPAAADTASLRPAGPSPERLQRALRGDLDTVVLMALRKEPERRYASVDQLADDVVRFLEGRAVRARPDTWSYRSAKFVTRHRWAVAAVAAILLLLVGYATTVTVQRQQIALERDAARVEAAKAREVTSLLLDLFELSDPERARGRDLTAREVLDRGAQRLRARGGAAESGLRGQPGVRGQLLGALGEIYRKLGLYEESEPLLEEALELKRASYDAPSLDVAQALLWRARLAQDTSSFPVARSFAQMAYDEATDAAGPEAPLALDALALSGHVAVQMAEMDDGERRIRAALEAIRATDDAQRTIRYLGMLSEVLFHRRDLDASLDALEEARALSLEQLGPDHPETLEIEVEVAYLLLRRGEPDRAEALLRDVLERTARVFGPRHPRHGMVLAHLSEVFEARDENSAAEAPMREALEIFRASLGDEALLTIAAFNGLGVNLLYQDRYDEAEELFRRALEGNRALFGDRHLRVAQNLYNLASLYIAAGRRAEAETAFRDALAIYEHAYGPDHPTVARTLASIAWQQLIQGQWTDAEALTRRAIALYESTPPDRGADPARPRTVLAWVLLDQGRVDEAVEVARAAVDTQERLAPEQRGWRSLTDGVLAAAYAAAGRRDEAMAHFAAALPVLRAEYGADHWYTSRVEAARTRADLPPIAGETP